MEENKNNVSVESGDVLIARAPNVSDYYYYLAFNVLDELGNNIPSSDLSNVQFNGTPCTFGINCWETPTKYSSATTGTLTFEYNTSNKKYQQVSTTITTSNTEVGDINITLELATLSSEITRIKTAKESLRTALNTLVPKMVGDDLSLDYYGGLIDNVISTSKITVKAQTAISTGAAANTAVATARKLKQPLVVWWGSAATVSQGCSNIAKLNYADCYGARFCYLSTSWTGTTFGPIDLTECPSYPCLIFIDPECPDTDPVSGVDYYAVSVDASKITKAVVQSGLGQLVTIAGRL